ncbi:hypothetical protein HOD29_01610 [archaeon]|jgi:hypothetical protein|nr:hypothetical protein [archaeon]MBT6995416.1 hypothetical protein [Candidatus Woesearchaeota archaeon]
MGDVEKAKQFIENTLKDYASSDYGPDDPLYNFFCAVEDSLKERISYEMIKRFENGENLSANYDFGKNKSKWGGITFSFNKTPSNIWIPENYIKKVQTHNPSLEGFEVFDQDEYNSFIESKAIKSKENKNLVVRVLYCEDENRQSIGDKKTLFLKDPEWREDAKKYSKLLLKTINENFKDEGYLDMFENSERARKGFKAVELATRLYLSEMKD